MCAVTSHQNIMCLSFKKSDSSPFKLGHCQNAKPLKTMTRFLKTCFSCEVGEKVVNIFYCLASHRHAILLKRSNARTLTALCVHIAGWRSHCYSVLRWLMPCPLQLVPNHSVYILSFLFTLSVLVGLKDVLNVPKRQGFIFILLVPMNWCFYLNRKP